MRWIFAATTFLIVLFSCVRQPPEWYTHQDRSIRMPPFDATTKIDLVVDGATLQALRIAADDFLPVSSSRLGCSYAQGAHIYSVSRSGDIIFIEIAGDPHACGGQGHSLDGAARYAISKDGRILRRVLDGEPSDVEGEDAGPSYDLLGVYTDGGRPPLDLRPFPAGPYAPVWMLDAGTSGTPDGGVVGTPITRGGLLYRLER